MPGPNDAFDLSAELADIPGGHVVDPTAIGTPEPPTPPASGDEPAPPAAPIVPDTPDWFAGVKPVFKEILEEEPASIDDVKAKITELKELRLKAKDYDPEKAKAATARVHDLELEVEELMKDINPLSHFRSEEAYRAEQMARLFPENNPDSIHKIMAADLDKLSVVDAIRLHLEFTYGITSPDEQKEWIEEQYGVDISDDEFAPKAKMKTDAIDFKKQLKTIKTTELPKIKDYKAMKDQRTADATAKQEKLTTDWAPVVDKAVASLKKISIPFKNAEGKDEPLEFAIEEATLTPYAKKVTEILSKGGRELNEDNLKGAMTSVYERLLIDNLPKIILSYANRELVKLDESWAKETHNPRKINQQQRPPEHQDVKPNSKEAAEAELLRG